MRVMTIHTNGSCIHSHVTCNGGARETRARESQRQDLAPQRDALMQSKPNHYDMCDAASLMQAATIQQVLHGLVVRRK